MIDKIEFMLKNVISKYVIIDKLNNDNFHTFDLYYVLLLKLRLQRIRIEFDHDSTDNAQCDNFEKCVRDFMNEVQPYYDYFLGGIKKRTISVVNVGDILATRSFGLSF